VRTRLLERWQRLRRRAYGETIQLADLRSFAAQARRARKVRIGFAAALIGAAVAAFVLAPVAPGRRFLPSNTVGIVVLDLSASIKPGYYFRIEHELATLAASRERFGLVLVSDVAYEALPPGTPASELKPLLRFFAPPTSPQGRVDTDSQDVPRSPWQEWFSAGTDLSSGLFLAADMLNQGHVKRGGVVLISDLADDPTDLARLADAVLLFEQRHIPLQIVGLDPTPADAEFFKNLLGTQAVTEQATLPTSNEARGRLGLVASFPRDLLVVACLVIALLVLDEWWFEPLRFRSRRAT
jgi:hypothetical protein